MITVSTPKYKVVIWDNVGLCGFNHVEKYEFVNGKDDIPYMTWKIKAMFQTTKQMLGLVNPQSSDQLHGFCQSAATIQL